MVSVSNISNTEIRLEGEELRQVTLFAATCAQPVLAFFEERRPLDTRPREAIAEAEAFAAGKRRTTTLRAAAWAALASAREVGEGPSAQAAYAASHAAASAYLHPIASPHQIKHILGAAVHQALAFELAAENDREMGNERLRWAASRATSTVRDVLRCFPHPPRGRGRFNELLNDLDAMLRD
jgi:hypothetical protein